MLVGILTVRLGGVTGEDTTGSAGLVGRSRAADLTGRSGPDETIRVSENRVAGGSSGL